MSCCQPQGIAEHTNAMAYSIKFMSYAYKNMKVGEIALIEKSRIYKYANYMEIQTIVPGVPPSVLNDYDAKTNTYPFLESLKSKVKEYYGIDVSLSWEDGVLSVILA